MIFDPLGPYCPAAGGLAWAFRPACSRLVCAAAGIEPRRPRRVENAPEARSFPAPRAKRRPERGDGLDLCALVKGRPEGAATWS
ncbi:hypothetical protein NDU88_005436 [Pleurodeles waltl]|uniref:Uncharacterized protein n=1 Tax=Pleurodeles waltl TaxID=8319 RepID=A0AAV7MXW1_PLEWA|nr:hypothetical protein NDU88_005436 [Pleurodeles waltl]